MPECLLIITTSKAYLSEESKCSQAGLKDGIQYPAMLIFVGTPQVLLTSDAPSCYTCFQCLERDLP
jgi:hypothetical protein